MAKHRDIVADGIVEDKHVLLHDGNKAVERFRCDGAQLALIEADAALIVVAAAHEQVHERGLAAAGCADDGIAFSGLKADGNIVQDGRTLVIAVGQVIDGDTVAQDRVHLFAALADVFPHGVGQLVDEGNGGAAVGQNGRHGADGIDHEAHERQEYDDNAGRNALLRHGKIGAEQEHAELGHDSGAGTEHGDDLLHAAATALRLLQFLVTAAEAGNDLGLCLEALDNGEARQKVLRHGDERLVLPRDLRLHPRQPVAAQDGNSQRHERQQQGKAGEQGTVEQHHDQAAHKGDALCQKCKDLRKVICLDADGIVRQGGDIAARILVRERADAFLRQLREGVFFILLHGAPQKGGVGIALHHIDRRHAHQNTETQPAHANERGNAVAGGNVDDLLQDPGDGQQRAAEQEHRSRRDKECGFILSIERRGQLPAQRPGAGLFRFHNSGSSMTGPHARQRHARGPAGPKKGRNAKCPLQGCSERICISPQCQR